MKPEIDLIWASHHGYSLLNFSFSPDTRDWYNLLHKNMKQCVFILLGPEHMTDAMSQPSAKRFSISLQTLLCFLIPLSLLTKVSILTKWRRKIQVSRLTLSLVLLESELVARRMVLKLSLGDSELWATAEFADIGESMALPMMEPPATLSVIRC